MEAKERMNIPRQFSRELPVAGRITNFDEVVSGYGTEAAQLEAERCLQCKKPKCREGCPVHNDIPGFIKLLREGKIVAAVSRPLPVGKVGFSAQLAGWADHEGALYGLGAIVMALFAGWLGGAIMRRL